VRLWYNGDAVDAGAARDAGSRLDATIGGVTRDVFLRTGAALSETAGVARTFVARAVNSAAACPARPFSPIGTWTTAAEPAPEVDDRLQGAWTAARAVRDGAAADDVVGHRLSFSGDRFEIQAADGTTLFAGTVRTDPSARPAAIDFEHTEGALAGAVWRGIYAVHGATLKVCDNAPDLDRSRPGAFAARRGSGYVLITFERAAP
jgi:uncharacterized protein (TIGR03067 family)